jgi:hypothetical protein
MGESLTLYYWNDFRCGNTQVEAARKYQPPQFSGIQLYATSVSILWRSFGFSVLLSGAKKENNSLHL